MIFFGTSKYPFIWTPIPLFSIVLIRTLPGEIYLFRFKLLFILLSLENYGCVKRSILHVRCYILISSASQAADFFETACNDEDAGLTHKAGAMSALKRTGEAGYGYGERAARRRASFRPRARWGAGVFRRGSARFTRAGGGRPAGSSSEAVQIEKALVDRERGDRQLVKVRVCRRRCSSSPYATVTQRSSEYVSCATSARVLAGCASARSRASTMRCSERSTMPGRVSSRC